jgi:hypothetical protein
VGYGGGDCQLELLIEAEGIEILLLRDRKDLGPAGGIILLLLSNKWNNFGYAFVPLAVQQSIRLIR